MMLQCSISDDHPGWRLTQQSAASKPHTCALGKPLNSPRPVRNSPALLLEIVMPSIHNHLEMTVALARLLERVEAGTVCASADGYLNLVRQLQSVLREDMPAAALQAILQAHRAAGEVYENLHYKDAGLSRAPLERSVSSELLTKQLLTRIASGQRSST